MRDWIGNKKAKGAEIAEKHAIACMAMPMLKVADAVNPMTITGPIQVAPPEMEITLHSAPTVAGQLRFHAQKMKEIANCPSRKLTAQKELRKVGLIPQPVRRKRKKWPGL